MSENLEKELFEDQEKAKANRDGKVKDVEDSLANEKPQPIELPSWAEKIDFQTIKIWLDPDKKYWVTVVDQGIESLQDFMSLQDMSTANAKQKFPLAFARLVEEFNVPVAKAIPALSVKRGDLLPEPSSYIRDHKKAWREFKRAIKESTVDPEDYPETKLTEWANAFGTSSFRRILQGLTFLVNEGLGGN